MLKNRPQVAEKLFVSEIILVVDDDPDIRTIVSVMIGEFYELVFADSAKSAMGRLVEFPVDLVLTDIHMPGEDGFSLLKKIIQKDSDLPVIMMTGYGSKYKAIDAIVSGAFDFIDKPIDPDILLFSIQKAIQLRKYIVAKALAAITLKSKASQMEEFNRNIKSAQLHAGCVIHEVMNPITVIKNKIETIQKLLSMDKPDVNILKKSASDINRMVDRITKISRSMRTLSEDGIDLPMESISLATLINETVQVWRDSFGTQGVKLTVSDIPSDLMIICRDIQISQVVLNMLRNAFNAAIKTEEKWITLDLINHPEIIEIQITDSGHGISEDMLKLLFTPFFSTRKGEGGTGLGLYICKKVIEEHNGNVSVNVHCSNTRFVIRLLK